MEHIESTTQQPACSCDWASEAPIIIHQHDVAYVVFHELEVSEIEFRLRMFPTTPRRQQGDRVEVSYTHLDEGTAEVESLLAAPDEETMRQRHKDYLARIEGRDSAAIYAPKPDQATQPRTATCRFAGLDARITLEDDL